MLHFITNLKEEIRNVFISIMIKSSFFFLHRVLYRDINCNVRRDLLRFSDSFFPSENFLH